MDDWRVKSSLGRSDDKFVDWQACWAVHAGLRHAGRFVAAEAMWMTRRVAVQAVEEVCSHHLVWWCLSCGELERVASRPVLSSSLKCPALIVGSHPFQTQVPYSPHLSELFFGEEMIMAVRLFTHGWDVYAPPEALVFHQWSRAHRPFFRETRQPDEEARAASERQVRSFLCTERKEGEEECGFCGAPAAEKYGEEYALGKVRTVREFAELCSLNFCKKRFEPKAKTLGSKACPSRHGNALEI